MVRIDFVLRPGINAPCVSSLGVPRRGRLLPKIARPLQLKMEKRKETTAASRVALRVACRLSC